MKSNMGLTGVTTQQLKRILSLIYRDQLPCPFHRSDLLVRGLNALAEEGDLLFGLERSAVQAVLVAVLSERKDTEDRLSRLKSALDRAHKALATQTES